MSPRNADMSTAIGPVRVRLAPDRSEVTLHIAPECPAGQLTRDALLATLRDYSVPISCDTETLIEAFLAEEATPGETRQLVVSRTVPPIDGTDGVLEWFVDEQAPSPAVADDAEPTTSAPSMLSGANEATDFYNRSTFITVAPGQVLGQITNPTPGVPGRDAMGEALVAVDGKPVSLKHDRSIQLNAQGQLIAAQQGVLVRTGDEAHISPILQVPEYVDFSTGNIAFDGSVVIRQGVRDRFTVNATGDIEVLGLIESATIICQGNLAARGGMAGRERGRVDVGADLIARYLDNVRGIIANDLCVEREVINCDLIVHGNVRSPNGAIVGGKTTVTGEIEISIVGSASGTPTTIVLGTVPRLETVADQFRNALIALQTQHDELQAEHEQLSRLMRKPRPEERKQLATLIQNLHHAHQGIERAKQGLAAVTAEIDRRRTVRLTIHRRLFHDTVLNIRGKRWHIIQDVPGPVRISQTLTGAVRLIREGSSPRPINEIARLVGDVTAADLA